MRKAEDFSEFIENLADNGHNNGLIVIAPHGGNIEKYTDEQAEHVGQKLSSEYVSEWICKGFKKGGGAFDRWHITSTDISEESFPKLKTIMRRHFEYSVAFHGWRDESICIGGTMPTDVKQLIKRGHYEGRPELYWKSKMTDVLKALTAITRKTL